MRLQSNGFSSYGARLLASKVLALFLIVAPAVAGGSPLTVTALGDSLTQGYGLISQNGFVPQLRDWLERRGRDARVVNAGVSGDTSAGGLGRVEWTLTPDVDALIVALGGNDLLRGIDPAVTRANIEGILQAASEADVEVLLVGMEAPGNYGPDYKAEFDAIWPELSRAYDTLYHPDFFAGLGSDRPEDAMRYMQPDGIHPNAEGVRRIVDSIGPKVIDLIERAR